jgi:hypothetical protein
VSSEVDWFGNVGWEARGVGVRPPRGSNRAVTSDDSITWVVSSTECGLIGGTTGVVDREGTIGVCSDLTSFTVSRNGSYILNRSDPRAAWTKLRCGMYTTWLCK